MEAIKPFNPQNVSFKDFYYSFTNLDKDGKSINYFHFKDGIFTNDGSGSFNAFAFDAQQNDHILVLEKSIINLEKVSALEIIPHSSSFRFHFDNSDVFECEAPHDLKSDIKFCALAQIIMDAFTEIEENRAATGLNKINRSNFIPPHIEFH